MSMLSPPRPTLNPGAQRLHALVRALSAGRVKDTVRALVTGCAVPKKKVTGRPGLHEILGNL
ncbi:protein of unknown function [Beijerinckiaceae bacterium RH AL1]|jgi:hypothetical protein|nr:protein of unknown function [Beijerinckiaceae bacterium RH CH11]VVB47594.1 protein of unknown function [Beijerinckiaceae bacterium RH AL8]VVC55926.1 protein of unknown function [Beijerinckiaceae bacterium RH AL1]